MTITLSCFFLCKSLQETHQKMRFLIWTIKIAQVLYWPCTLQSGVLYNSDVTCISVCNVITFRIFLHVFMRQCVWVVNLWANYTQGKTKLSWKSENAPWWMTSFWSFCMTPTYVMLNPQCDVTGKQEWLHKSTSRINNLYLLARHIGSHEQVRVSRYTYEYTSFIVICHHNLYYIG